MVRGYHTRMSSRSILGKRRRSTYGTGIKKRKYTRSRRSKRIGTNTNRNSYGSAIGSYRTRKNTRRTWRSLLWRNTMAMSHYRSVGSASQQLTTPNNTTQASLAVIFPGRFFWTVGGGAQELDAGAGVPLFEGDVVLRGGIVKMSFTNNWSSVGGSDPVRVVVFAVWTNPDPNLFAFSAVQPLLWDPSHQQEFRRYGKVLYRREWLLKGDSEVCELTHRMRVQKIDQGIHQNFGSSLAFFVLVSQTANTEAVIAGETVTIVNSISFSFSGDTA